MTPLTAAVDIAEGTWVRIGGTDFRIERVIGDDEPFALLVARRLGQSATEQGESLPDRPFGYLDDDVQPLLWGQNTERVSRILSDVEPRIPWIDRPAQTRVFGALQDLLGATDGGGGGYLAIVGPRGAGKRTIVERFEEQASAQAADRGDTSIPVVLLRSWASSQGLYEACVDRCDATSSEFVRQSGLKVEQRRKIAIDAMKAAGVRVLIVEQLHHYTNPRSMHIRRRVENLDAFVRELGIALVCLHDSTLSLPGTWPSPWRYARQVTLHPCTLGPEFDLALRSFERRLPLREASKLDAPDLAGRLYAFCRGDLGLLWLRLVECSVHALYSESEKIDHEVIDSLEESEREAEDRTSWDI